jgi:hypothetical protein
MGQKEELRKFITDAMKKISEGSPGNKGEA